jgi:hypothetical protein
MSKEDDITLGTYPNGSPVYAKWCGTKHAPRYVHRVHTEENKQRCIRCGFQVVWTRMLGFLPFQLFNYREIVQRYEKEIFDKEYGQALEDLPIHEQRDIHAKRKLKSEDRK